LTTPAEEPTGIRGRRDTAPQLARHLLRLQLSTILRAVRAFPSNAGTAPPTGWTRGFRTFCVPGIVRCMAHYGLPLLHMRPRLLERPADGAAYTSSTSGTATLLWVNLIRLLSAFSCDTAHYLPDLHYSLEHVAGGRDNLDTYLPAYALPTLYLYHSRGKTARCSRSRQVTVTHSITQTGCLPSLTQTPGNTTSASTMHFRRKQRSRLNLPWTARQFLYHCAGYTTGRLFPQASPNRDQHSSDGATAYCVMLPDNSRGLPVGCGNLSPPPANTVLACLDFAHCHRRSNNTCASPATPRYALLDATLRSPLLPASPSTRRGFARFRISRITPRVLPAA